MATFKHTPEILRRRLTIPRPACRGAGKNEVNADGAIEIIADPDGPALRSNPGAFPAMVLSAQKERFP